MTLIVSTYRRLPDGSLEWLEPAIQGDDLAGVESSRQAFWDSAATKALGLQMVLELASGDIWAEGADLDRLEQEIDTLFNNLDYFPGQQEYWHARLNNVRAAIQRARQLPDGQGGVYIG